jgi:hypothetical protein
VSAGHGQRSSGFGERSYAVLVTDDAISLAAGGHADLRLLVSPVSELRLCGSAMLAAGTQCVVLALWFERPLAVVVFLATGIPPYSALWFHSVRGQQCYGLEQWHSLSTGSDASRWARPHGLWLVMFPSFS